MDVDWPCARSPAPVGKRFLTWYADNVPYLRSRQGLARLCYLTVTDFLGTALAGGDGTSHRSWPAPQLAGAAGSIREPGDGTLMA
jgi:hypothetical protein